MANKSKFLIPALILGAFIGGYHASNTGVLNRTQGSMKPSTSIEQTVSEDYIPSKGANVQNDFQYSYGDIWYNRLSSLEELAKTADSKSISEETISDLKEISHKDEDWRIRELASSMINSYETRKDFSDTEPYQELQAENLRLTINPETDFGYKPSDIWYDRLESLENLVKNTKEVSPGIVSDLRMISAKDDDWRIRDLASSMVRSYESTNDFSGVKLHH